VKVGSKLLASACIAEGVTGLALLVAPSLVVLALFGTDLIGVALTVSRVAGVTLIALAIACWPNLQRANDRAYAAMLIYNVLVALLLADAGIGGIASGTLLWLTTAFHTIMAILLALSWFRIRNRQGIGGQR